MSLLVGRVKRERLQLDARMRSSQAHAGETHSLPSSPSYSKLRLFWSLPSGSSPPINSTNSTGRTRQPSFARRASSLPRCYPLQVTRHLEVQTWHVSYAQRVSSAVVNSEPDAEEWEEGRFNDQTWTDDSVLANAGHEDEWKWEVGFECEIGEADVLELEDGYAATAALGSGFCVERGGFFLLDRMSIAKCVAVATSTSLSSGTTIKDGEIFGHT
ncbi:hypothetical protein FIBSPDRAFT_184208 [Athelia psychrophila]|uniref:Uncharacterized protein n=1 Tax=Athelia psychrophila TaxID=1759441 RepID=A0A166AFF9_9AGAM|nr:hypothetical protein FIBSPDRAFT_184208 [Fibularhizoctonia sp. CBS 109695]